MKLEENENMNEFEFYDKFENIRKICCRIRFGILFIEIILILSAISSMLTSIGIYFGVINEHFDYQFVEFISRVVIPINIVIPLNDLSELQVRTITFGGTGTIIALWAILLFFYYRIVKEWSKGKSPFDVKYIRKVRWLSGTISIGTGIFQPIFMLSGFILYIFIYILDYGNALERNARNTIKSQEQIILSFAEITEAKSGQTGKHVKRVSEYCRIIAEGMELCKSEVEEIRIASMMHDVGKIMIPEKILGKPGKLSEEEFEIIKTHTSMGEQMLHNAEGAVMKKSRIIALEHHEKWNGCGYEKKNGKSISLEARIVAVADVYDALISNRSYKKSWDADKAYNLIVEEAGEHFDPDVVKVFQRRYKEILAVRKKHPD